MTRSSESPRLQGARVQVRPWQRRDTNAQDSWPPYTDTFNTLWNIPRTTTFSDDDVLWFSSADGRRVWAIEDERQRLIGRISLREIDLQARRARLGISLGSPYLGQGLGTEALALFLDYFFGPLDFQMMLLDVAAFNRRAVRCYEYLGFQCVGTDWRNAGNDPSVRLLDDPAYADMLPYFRRSRHGTFVQFLEMELHRSDWLAHQHEKHR